MCLKRRSLPCLALCKRLFCLCLLFDRSEDRKKEMIVWLVWEENGHFSSAPFSILHGFCANITRPFRKLHVWGEDAFVLCMNSVEWQRGEGRMVRFSSFLSLSLHGAITDLHTFHQTHTTKIEMTVLRSRLSCHASCMHDMPFPCVAWRSENCHFLTLSGLTERRKSST